MADTKISGLTALTGANTASGDLLTIVDISDTTMAATGTNKSISLTQLQSAPVSAGTANGVLYLNGSKVATSGSALVFDGSNLGVGVTSPDRKLSIYTTDATGKMALFSNGNTNTNLYLSSDPSSGGSVFNSSNNAATAGLPFLWQLNGSEAMRLTTTGLGIGTSSPADKLDVNGTIRIRGGNYLFLNNAANDSLSVIYNGGSTGAGNLQFNTGGAERMRLDSSGNLGLGVTPSAWTTYKALQVNSSLALMGDGAASIYGNNAYYNSGWKYANSNYAALYVQNNGGNGAHAWYTAPSGTVGNAITLTQALTLNADGSLLIGGTSTPGAKVLYIANASTVPSSNPSGGGVIYVEGGALKYRGSSGTVTTLASA